MATFDDSGEGWLSDESDFYGDTETRETLEKKAQRLLQSSSMLSYGIGRTNVKQESGENGTVTNTSHHTITNRPASPQPGPSRTERIDSMQDLVKIDHFKGRAGAWQQSETVLDFLRRMPVLDQKTSTPDGWLWVASPMLPCKQRDQLHNQDLVSLMAGGNDLLERFEAKRSEVEENNSGKTPIAVSRKISSHRQQLEKDLLALAVTTKTTCGKWMMFPGKDDLPRYWRLVAEATVSGKLGPTSKVATPDSAASNNETLICVYTYSFSDMGDVRRVLHELRHLGLVRESEKPIYWKADAYTHLNLNSGNRFNIRASLYSSKDLL